MSYATVLPPVALARIDRLALVVASGLSATIRTYLKEYRDAKYERNDCDPITRETENLERLRGRVETVTNGKLNQLQARDDLSLGSSRTVVNIKIVCENCHAQYDVFELLNRGGCNCE